MSIRVYLRQSLFSLSGDAAHLPPGVAILVGKLENESPTGLQVKVVGWLDEKGRTLEGKPRTLIVPHAKIDHVWVTEG